MPTLQRTIDNHPKATAGIGLLVLLILVAIANFIGNYLLRHRIFNTEQRTAVDSAKDVAVDLAVLSALLLSITTLIYAGKAVSSSNCSIFKSRSNDLNDSLVDSENKPGTTTEPGND